jgi:hypothetical protein
MMARVSGIHFAKKARALAAALLLGTAILSLAPGHAEAARRVVPEAGDTDSGDSSGGSTAERKSKNQNGSQARCTITRADGHVDFYLEGEKIVRNGRGYYCGGDGQWHAVRTSGASTGTVVEGGGVYAP